MASEFHLFASLPAEIRLKIWKHALRPDNPSRPGAQFFSVTNFREDGDALTSLKVQCDLGSRCEYNHGETYYLAAPKFGTSHSWTNNNPSSYLWDFGMWSACAEPRAIIKGYYKMEYWAAKLLKTAKTILSPTLMLMLASRLYSRGAMRTGALPYVQIEILYASNRSIRLL